MFPASISTNHMEAIELRENASYSRNFSHWEKEKKVAATNEVLINVFKQHFLLQLLQPAIVSRSVVVGFTSSSRWSFI